MKRQKTPLLQGTFTYVATARIPRPILHKYVYIHIYYILYDIIFANVSGMLLKLELEAIWYYVDRPKWFHCFVLPAPPGTLRQVYTWYTVWDT